MASSPSGPKWADLLCPICFDMGFVKTTLRAQLNDDEKHGSEFDVSQTSHNPGDDGAIAASERVVTDANPKPSQVNPLISATMRHTDDGRVDDKITVPINLRTIDPDVSGLLLEGRRPESDEALYHALPKARIIKSMMIPFKYWLEQSCPAGRNDVDPPCEVIRKGLHNYLMQKHPGYVAKQKLLMDLGYVEEGSTHLAFRIGHPSVPSQDGDDGLSIPAAGWSVEGFLTSDIPSPWRNPWHPDDGFVVGKRSLTSGDTASDDAFQKATSWFINCATSHPDCLLPDSTFLPGRVLDIGRDANDPVVARSGVETTSVTSGTIEAYHDEIPWDKLAPTFQDAIRFLRNFSAWHAATRGEPVQYLWIDSLCIIQDSDDDKLHQLQNMCDIYSNSLFTIVESVSEGGEKRLFSQSNRNHVPESVRVKDGTGNTQDFHYRHSILHPNFQVNNNQIPIWTRSWVLQERLLSPRLLIFGSEELSWQCSVCNRCECGLEELHTKMTELMQAWKTDNFINRLPPANSRKNLSLILGPSPSEVPLRKAWRLVLETYSGLHITDPRDKLKAIAGLARGFNRQLGEKKYFAGIWYENQVGHTPMDQSETTLDLLWRLRYRSDARRPNRRRPQVDISWSWAIPECSIIYPFVNDEVLARYSITVSLQCAHNVLRLPNDHDTTRPWVNCMYSDAPYMVLNMIGPLWKTKLAGTSTTFTIQETEDQEYMYYLGPMSDVILQERAMGRPIEVNPMLVQPPLVGGSSGEDVFSAMPPILFYPDDLLTSIDGPLFCLPLVKVRHGPAKQGLKEKAMVVALVLEAVGHAGTVEGTDPNLEGQDPSELVFRRLGLAYTLYGGWTEDHEMMIRGLTRNIIRIV